MQYEHKNQLADTVFHCLKSIHLIYPSSFFKKFIFVARPEIRQRLERWPYAGTDLPVILAAELRAQLTPAEEK
jgi:hypothetical protein